MHMDAAQALSLLRAYQRGDREEVAAQLRGYRRVLEAQTRERSVAPAGRDRDTQVEPSKPTWRLDPADTEASRRPSWLVNENVDFRPDVEPRTTVKLSRPARRTVMEEIHSARPDGVETGGALISAARGEVIEITNATGPGPNANQEAHAMDLDLDHFEKHSEWLRSQFGVAARVIGAWHIHPTLFRHANEPSPRDLHVFEDMLGEDPGARFVAIIVNPTPIENPRTAAPEVSWFKPRWTAWALRRVHGGSAVCEPANLIEAAQ